VGGVCRTPKAVAMPEFHPGTDIEIPDGVPTSLFRCAIPNPKRYMKPNAQTLDWVCESSFEGDYERLEELLATGDELNLFNGDINAHQAQVTPLMLAAMAGQTECVELLLEARADPHVKERMPYGQDPEDGRTALEFASAAGYDDIVEIVKAAQETTPYGWYVPEGPGNNKKCYGCWEWGTKPPRGWYSSRPGVAERCGFDVKKYGTGACKIPTAAPIEEDWPGKAEESETPEAPAAPAAPAALAPLPELPAPEGLDFMPVGLLFPGQGSQYVKMLSDVQSLPPVQSMLQKAQDILGYNILELCLEGPEEKLEETRFCQPAMFIAGLAALERLRVDRPDVASRFRVTAGLSLGEYTALCAAGVFSFERGLRLVQLRGQAMQEAAAMSKQSMLSVAGLEKSKLAPLCREAAEKEGVNGVCQIANELFPKGFSCAGTELAMKMLKELVEANGALQARVLKTSGGFHTSLMAPARDRLSSALDEALPSMKPPQHAVFMNVTAQPCPPGSDPREIVELLKRQLTSPVLWEASVRAMISEGVTEFYELGPMKQVKAMMKRIDQKAWSATTNIEV